MEEFHSLSAALATVQLACPLETPGVLGYSIYIWYVVITDSAIENVVETLINSKCSCSSKPEKPSFALILQGGHI